VSQSSLTLVFFIYGLAFFTMGLLVALEGGRASDRRLRHALRPLAVFGLLHGLHEWMEMFERLGQPAASGAQLALWQGLRLAMLSFSFLSLTAFGASLLSPTEQARRLSLSIPIVQVTPAWGRWRCGRGWAWADHGCGMRASPAGAAGGAGGGGGRDRAAAGVPAGGADGLQPRQPVGGGGLCLVWAGGPTVR
jgi:hypothetical protein